MSRALPGRRAFFRLAWSAALAAAPAPAVAQPSGPMPTDIGFRPRFGERAPLSAVLADERGRAVHLGRYFTGERPVVMVLAYFNCPMLCSLVLKGLTAALRDTGLAPGEDYEVVVVSIDPRDTPERAAKENELYSRMLDRPGAAEAMHFLTGPEEAVRRVADGVGFRYEYDPIGKQYAHAGGAIVLAPDGVISRYLNGVDFDPRDLRLALVEAAGGKVGGAADRLLLLCYRYDPESGTYGAAALRAMRAGGVLTVAALGVALLVLRRRAPGRGRRSSPPGGEGTGR